MPAATVAALAAADLVWKGRADRLRRAFFFGGDPSDRGVVGEGAPRGDKVASGAALGGGRTAADDRFVAGDPAAGPTMDVTSIVEAAAWAEGARVVAPVGVAGHARGEGGGGGAGEDPTPPPPSRNSGRCGRRGSPPRGPHRRLLALAGTPLGRGSRREGGRQRLIGSRSLGGSPRVRRAVPRGGIRRGRRHPWWRRHGRPRASGGRRGRARRATPTRTRPRKGRRWGRQRPVRGRRRGRDARHPFRSLRRGRRRGGRDRLGSGLTSGGGARSGSGRPACSLRWGVRDGRPPPPSCRQRR